MRINEVAFLTLTKSWTGVEIGGMLLFTEHVRLTADIRDGRGPVDLLVIVIKA